MAEVGRYPRKRTGYLPYPQPFVIFTLASKGRRKKGEGAYYKILFQARRIRAAGRKNGGTEPLASRSLSEQAERFKQAEISGKPKVQAS